MSSFILNNIFKYAKFLDFFEEGEIIPLKEDFFIEDLIYAASSYKIDKKLKNRNLIINLYKLKINKRMGVHY